ncbi:MAG TPA: hypothetical protein V6D29_13665 [Leptolyngbyaceae cyanobacterium]
MLLWKEWAEAYPSQPVAIAETICIINKWVKRLPRYKERGKVGNRIVDAAYFLKDTWLKANAGSITKAEISVSKTMTWFDGEGFAWAKASSGGEWIDDDEFWMEKQYILYAYELQIEDQMYRFHSEKKLRENLPFNPDSAGRAAPLGDDEVERFKSKSIGLIDLLRMLSAALELNGKDSHFWTSTKLSSEAKYFHPINKKPLLI